MQTDISSWKWRPAGVAIDSRSRGVQVQVEGHAEAARDTWPRLHAFTGKPIIHIAGWRSMVAGSAESTPDDEEGARAGYAEPGFDDSGWYKTSRINEVSFCFPTWEGDSYRGYLWYRTELRTGDVRPNRLILGSHGERRGLAWRVFINGTEVTSGPQSTPIVDLSIPESALPQFSDSIVIAVQVLVEPPELEPERLRERESWRRVDLQCLQILCVDEPWQEIPLALTEADGHWLTLTGGDTSVRAVYDTCGGVVRKVVSVRNDGTADVTIARAELAASHPQGPVSYHSENAWAIFGDQFLCVAHPAGFTGPIDDRPTAHVWPGVTLRPGETHAFPEVLFGRSDTGNGIDAIRRILQAVGRDPEPRSIYDPYGWYEISHPTQPNVELTESLIGEIEVALGAIGESGRTFDMLSLDCGWNDPNDILSFHPVNFPSGPAPVLDLVKRRDLELMLWVSPSDGPRAFRNELGFVNPGLEDCMAGSGLLTWRLCPAAEPWAGQFRSALVHHVDTHGVRGFKLDGLELWCSRDTHGHVPGLWSLYATSRTLATTLQTAHAAGAGFLMLYWGFRSPWWLRFGSTLYERDYLVEAAAPSGQASWGLRSAVCSSQDIGHQSSWEGISPHQQDSLGVWISETSWASWQGAEGWRDSFIMDIARGSLLQQLWGDLRMLAPTDDPSLAELWQFGEEAANHIARSQGSLIAGRPWDSDTYGYRWDGDGGSLIVLARSAHSGSTVVDLSGAADGRVPHASVRLGYLSPGRQAAIEISDDERVTVTQEGGSVVALFVAREGGSRHAGAPFPSHEVLEWVQGATGTRSLDFDADEDLIVSLARGRCPQVVAGPTGAVNADLRVNQMVAKLPPDDRSLIETNQTWSGRARMYADGEAAVFVSLDRGGVAWHNDRLHELVHVQIVVDGDRVPVSVIPHRTHEQAGSWSWVAVFFDLSEGEHRLLVTARSATPDNVATTAQLILR